MHSQSPSPKTVDRLARGRVGYSGLAELNTPIRGVMPPISAIGSSDPVAAVYPPSWTQPTGTTHSRSRVSPTARRGRRQASYMFSGLSVRDSINVSGLC